MQRTNPQSAEYQVIRTYLDYIVELPFGSRAVRRQEHEQVVAGVRAEQSAAAPD